MKTKKYLSCAALLLALTCLTPTFEARAESYSKTFIISAYYSPLPCQDRYATGSYDGDRRLNGNGTNGADGTPVYAGMIAAPKTYAFGTKMNIPGLGMVAVHDRGGAIVSADSGRVAYDRLDVWMGYGDAGLKRALTWGKRTVDVTVHGVDPSIQENFQIQGFTPDEATPKCGQAAVSQPTVNNPVTEQPKPQSPKVESAQPVVTVVPPAETIEDKLFDADLKTGDRSTEVRRLQDELRRLNYFKVESTAVYGDLTTHAVFKFQQAQGLVGSKEDVGAGVFGPKTRERMNEIVQSRSRIAKLIEKRVESGNEVAVGGPVNDQKYVFAPFTRELDPGVMGNDVKILQTILKEEGYFDLPYVTEFYGEQTRQAVLRFQIANGIITAATDLGAGRVGPATLVKLNSLLSLEF